MSAERIAELRHCTEADSSPIGLRRYLTDALDALEASQAQCAALCQALGRLIEKHPNGHWYSNHKRMADEEGAVLENAREATGASAPASSLAP